MISSKVYSYMWDNLGNIKMDQTVTEFFDEKAIV